VLISGLRGSNIADDVVLEWFEASRISLYKRVRELTDRIDER
jgi:hypothetical protein